MLPYSATDASAQSLPWYAIKVRTRSEPVAVTALRNKGYQALSPSVAERRRYSDRMAVVHTPAFPGYIFCRLDAREKVPVLSCPAVDYIVGFGGALTTVPDDEIDGVCRLLDAGASPRPYLAVGQKIRVEYGSLAGLEGILERFGKQNRLVVSLQLLQRSVSLDIDENQIRTL
jgi:transcription antitermination factor NusG